MQAKRIAVGLDRGEQKLAAHRRADLAHAERRARPARERRAAAPPRPDVIDLAVVGDEEDFVRRVTEARGMLDRFVYCEHLRPAFAYVEQRPLPIAQARDHDAVAAG